MLLYIYLLESNDVTCCAQSFQSGPTLHDPADYSPLVSCVHGILQAKILEWVAMPFSRESSPPRDQTHVSCISSIASGFFTVEPLGKPYDVIYL